ncbi:MAG: TetR/AcrR family transcriptional regulator [Sphingomonadaceae bacterium]|jgi:AcrR family transcriptional regulator|nr:TetR/AcrR family transcriptional regulator [Sphingomonadaceae bacterium]MCP5383214.1 TetR/AcrR family transcriptional regulator [Altererythrobacter sp.]MCP5393391.1 TetR/AcrR family transcriptional regulator [Sphingomonadaceae bacterium]
MGRRSDHTAEELRELLLAKGHALMAETGFAAFSGRQVARRAGYSVGTIYNVFGSLDALLAAINTRTFELWADWLRRALADGGEDRIASLVRGYFDFALAHPLLWSAIYEHRLPDGQHLSEDDLARRAELTGIVQQEVAAILPADTPLDVARYARSLIAGVHGHCSYVVTGSFALLDETDPLGSALDRVRESLAHHGAYNGANAPGT